MASYMLGVIAMPYVQTYNFAFVFKACQFVPKPDGRVIKTRHAIAQLLHQHLLAKGVALGVAMIHPLWLDARKLFPPPRKVMHAVALHHALYDLANQPSGLSRAQALVINRHGTRLAHRVAAALYYQRFYALHTEKIRQHQPGWPGTDDDNRKFNGRNLT